ncbi:hypothetical protein ACYT32_05480 [Companilactobacillus sp. FL22-3]
MRRMRPILILASLWVLFSACLPTTINAQTTANEPITDAGLDSIVDKKDNAEVIITYLLEDKKELHLKTDQKDVIDSSSLEKELGTEKVKENSEKNEIKLTLDDPNKASFKMNVDHEKPFLLTVTDANEQEIFHYQFNQPEKYVETVDDDDEMAEESTWTKTSNLRVSKGPIIEHEDGSSTQPIIYFGDYLQASRENATIASSWGERGNSRQNSLTAPNSGIIYAEEGSSVKAGPDAPKNHIYTIHYGDSQNKDYGTGLLEEELLPYGAPTSFTSNNLFNYVVKTDNSEKPGTSGPNKNGKSYAMYGLPNLYYRFNPRTGFEEQRLVYKQKAFYDEKKGRINPEITTTIKMSFTKTGRVITDITYKNTGQFPFKDFIGFSNHDLSLNKDGQELTDTNGKKIGNYIPMRSLSDNRGMYFQSPNNEVRTSFYMNQDDAPAGWSARSAGKSFVANKGYLYNPGLLGIVAARSVTYYPWKKGKAPSGKYFDDNKHRYNFPWTPKHYPNAFKDRNDTGDKANMRGAGGRLGTNSESDPNWDAGLTMRTKSKTLEIGESVHMQYGTLTDVPGSTFDPVVEYDNLGTEDNPQVLDLGTPELKLKGQWYDFDSEDVTIYYAIDSDAEEDMIKGLFHHGTQTTAEAQRGDFHSFEKPVDLSGLSKGNHKVYLVAIDSDGNESVVSEHYFKLVKTADKNGGPLIDVNSPSSTEESPFAPIADTIHLSGTWSDKKSNKITSLSYQVDEEPINIIQTDIKNKKPGNSVSWLIPSINISEYNDFEKHKVVVTIVNEKGQSSSDTFYFQHIAGRLNLTAPETIDFGSLSVSQTAGNPVSPDLKGGRIILDDFRAPGSNPVAVSLAINTFYKSDDKPNVDGNNGDDEDDDGDNDDDFRLDREQLLHDVFWEGHHATSKNVLVGRTSGPKNEQWQQKTDFTNDIVKNLQLSFRSNNNGSTPGKYVSDWTWEAVDSVQ